VMTRIAGGVPPDLVGAVSVEFVQYAAGGLIEPLNAYVQRDKINTGAIIPILVSALQWRGGQYLMPYGASGVTLVQNTRLFDEAGLARPPLKWNDPSWTWENFLTSMIKLTKRDSSGTTRQIGLAAPYWDSWITLPYNWGGDWIDEGLKRFTGTESEALASLQCLQDLRWVHQVMPRPGEGAGGTNGFLNGTAAMAGLGTWTLQQMMNSDQPLSLTPWFRVGNYPVKGAVNPVGIAMISSSKNKDEAWEFIKFATLDPEGNYLYAQAAGAVPGTAPGYRQWLDNINVQKPSLNVACFIEQVAEHAAIINIRKVTTFNEINGIMVAKVDEIYANTIAPKAAMDQVAQVIQELIDTSNH
jgi:multiple sugar transport system substrate-binding protein